MNVNYGQIFSALVPETIVVITALIAFGFDLTSDASCRIMKSSSVVSSIACRKSCLLMVRANVPREVVTVSRTWSPPLHTPLTAMVAIGHAHL